MSALAQLRLSVRSAALAGILVPALAGLSFTGVGAASADGGTNVGAPAPSR